MSAELVWHPSANVPDLNAPYSSGSAASMEHEQDWCWTQQVINGYSVRQIHVLFPGEFGGKRLSVSSIQARIEGARERHAVHVEADVRAGVNDALQSLRVTRGKKMKHIIRMELVVDRFQEHLDELLEGGYERLLTERVSEGSGNDNVMITIPLDLIANAKSNLAQASSELQKAIDSYEKSHERFLKWSGLLVQRQKIEVDQQVTHTLNPQDAQTLQRVNSALEKARASLEARQDFSAFQEVVDAEVVHS